VAAAVARALGQAWGTAVFGGGPGRGGGAGRGRGRGRGRKRRGESSDEDEPEPEPESDSDDEEFTASGRPKRKRKNRSRKDKDYVFDDDIGDDDGVWRAARGGAAGTQRVARLCVPPSARAHCCPCHKHPSFAVARARLLDTHAPRLVRVAV
jgi:hypothetical protein